MQIQLLGPLVVTVQGTSGAPPGIGERALLARLALHPGRVVSVDTLIDSLWGEDLPANPSNALQLRVSKLRRWLSQLGADASVLVTRAPGYLLDVPDSAVDARAVIDDLARSRAAAAAGSSAVAVERFRAALARWVGTPLADVSGFDWAEAESARLEQVRIGALEEVLDLELALGRHRTVLDELDRLVALHPLRERVHAQRMLALYRNGRQADALAAYQDLRRLLGEELGLDPSDELRRLEGAILTQDPDLDVPDGEGDAAAWVAPELPRRVATFRGRDADLEELGGLLEPGSIITCTGPGGTGKTTLAVEAARAAAPRFSAGAWLVPLASVGEEDELAAVVTAALGLSAAPLDRDEDAADRLARQLGVRQALVVLDNCEHVIDTAARLVEVLSTRCPGLCVLATSREALQVQGEVRYAVAPLGVPEEDADPDDVAGAPAVQVFVDRARALDRTFDPTTGLEPVAAICRRLDGLPLAIELAAARTTALSVADIAVRLEDQLGLLTGGPRTADARHQTLRATVRWSYELLSEDEQSALRRLSVFRSPWDLVGAEAVCADDELTAARLLDVVSSLVERSLVSRAGPGRFRLLETIRQFAAAELAASGEGEELAARHLDHMVELAESTDPHLRHGDQVRALETLRSANPDLRQALAFSEANLDTHGATGLRLAGALGWFWYLGDHEEGRRHLQRLLAATDVPAETLGRGLLAVSAVERPSACIVHPDEVCAEAARGAAAAFATTGNRPQRALAEVLAAVEGVRGFDTDAALATVDDAVAEFTASGDEWGLALVEFVRMEIGMRVDDGRHAIAHGERAAAAFARLGDLWGLSSVRGHQGANRRTLGDLDGALASYETALGVARDVGLHNSVQLLGAEISLLFAVLGDAESAHRALDAARAHARRHGYRGAIAAAHLVHAHLARWAGNLEGARDEYENACEKMASVNSMLFLVEATSGLGFTSEELGDLDAARAAHDEVVRIAGTLTEPRVLAVGLEGAAALAAARGEFVAATELLGRAAGVRDEHHRPPNPLEASDIARVQTTTRAALAEEDWAASHERGRATAGAGDELVPSPASG